MSLIPEKSIVISPTLAATIGLEESVLLQLLQECLWHRPTQRHGQFDWVAVDCQELLRLAPFWSVDKLKRIATSLQEKGILLTDGTPWTLQSSCNFAFNEPVTNAPVVHTMSPPMTREPIATERLRQRPQRGNWPIDTTAAQPINNDWQPSEDALRQLCQLGATRDFSLQQVPQFVAYWRDKNVPRPSWESKFLKEVWRQWQQSESSNQRRRAELPVTREWRPSPDALDILIEKGGINGNFVEDAIPEFILYWRERGDTSSTWDTKFVQHVRRQWHFYTGMMDRDTLPKPIESSWQPIESVYDVLQMANIERPFACQLIPEFVLYWQENGASQCSWSTKFLQYVKGQWARHNQTQLAESSHGKKFKPDSKGRIRDRSIIEALSDRSWAS
ncbi:MAG: DnaT-like ssDNA-binding domain-containing protein [Porticoccaceae bacterium]|nr:DnaT-like ssDNA-binding domain-containing protein [Porticoccaceae bacterium]